MGHLFEFISLSLVAGVEPCKAQLVSTNSLAYYNMVDLSCRTRCNSYCAVRLMSMFDLVDITAHFGEAAAQQLFITPQVIKAYVSAVASWVKAFSIRLTETPTAAAAPVAEAGAEQPSDHVRLMMERLTHLVALTPSGGESSSCQVVTSSDTAAGAAAGAWGQAYWTMQLAVLWWLSRAVADVLQLLLQAREQKKQGAVEESGSSNTATVAAAVTAGVGSRGSRSSTAVKAVGGAAVAALGGAAVGAEGGAAGSSSSVSAGVGASSTRGVDGGDKGGISMGASDASTSCSSMESGAKETAVGTQASKTESGILAAATLGKVFLESLQRWDARAHLQHKPGEADGAASARVSDALQQLLPKRMMSLPQKGLPAAVVKQLELLGGKWLHFDVLKVDREVQLQVLCDVVELCQVLQQEVPCPIGCNNPRCVDLKGVSEAVASCKTCTGCGVARYCSRECQVGHWKEHKATCRRLEKG